MVVKTPIVQNRAFHQPLVAPDTLDPNAKAGFLYGFQGLAM